MKIFNSASKLILILFGLAVVGGLFLGKIDQDTFKTFGLMVFSFYFGSKISSPPIPPVN